MGLVRSGMKDEALFEAIVVALEDKRNQDCYMIEPFIFSGFADYRQCIMTAFLRCKATFGTTPRISFVTSSG